MKLHSPGAFCLQTIGKKKKKPRLLRREFYTLLEDSGEGKVDCLVIRETVLVRNESQPK